jgi:hypothetical protein
LIFFMQIDVETSCGDNLIRHLVTFWTIEYFNRNPFTCLFVFNPFPELLISLITNYVFWIATWLIVTNLKIDSRAFSCKVTHLIIESKWKTKIQYTFELIDWFFSCRSMLKCRVVITWSDIWRRFELLNILIKIHLHVYLCLILFLNIDLHEKNQSISSKVYWIFVFSFFYQF